jgi:hypothetical protein
MKSEWRYLLTFAGWMALWWFLPWIAFCAMVFCLVRTFRALRRQRVGDERRTVAAKDPKMREWMRLEGFEVPDVERVDWWRRS